MNQYRDYEQTVMSAQRPKVPNNIVCQKCKCEWFEQFQVSKFDGNNTVAPGTVLPETFHTFTLLRCAKCGDIQEPPTATSGWDRLSQERYNVLLDDLTKPAEDKDPDKK